MKALPYSEIMNLKEEKEEYLRLCKNQSKKYKHYSNWERHIKNRLESVTNKEALSDFKHYCINEDRSESHSPEIFAAYITLVLAVLWDELFSDFCGPSKCISIVIFVGLVSFVNYAYKTMVVRESCFYADIVSIIEKLEENRCSPDNY